ncbi:MAG: pilus assembly protein PilM [Sedimentisphaerales bacterium]|nr:pilus assembly protein PilM [Sedimentisphaerales bacterium]
MLNWKLKGRSVRPIGLDIGSDSIKIIQLEIGNSHMKVTAADKIAIDPAVNGDGQKRKDFVVAAIRQSLKTGNFNRRKVVSCLPNESLKITSVRLAESDYQTVDDVLKKEVSERFGLNPQRDSVNYVVAGTVKQDDETKNELILFAADNEAIKAHIEMLEECELMPVAIDTVPCALFRSFQRSLRRQEDKEQTIVFTDVGSKFTTVVFTRDGDISFVKRIPIAGDGFDREVANKLGVSIDQAKMLRSKMRMQQTISPPAKESEIDTGLTNSDNQDDSSEPAREVALDGTTRQAIVQATGAAAEQLAREISLCLRYYTVTFRGRRIKRAILSGGEAYERIMLNVLRRQMSLEIEMAQPLKGFDMTNMHFDSDRRGLLCEWSVAAGLALKGVEN